VLKLYRAARRDNRRREKRGNVTDSTRERSGGCGGSGSAHGATRGGATAAGCRSAACPKTKQLGQYADRAERRRESGELAADTAQIAPEFPTAGTVAHVAPGSSPGAHAAIVSEHQLRPDLRACRVASLDRLRQTDACPDQQRLDRWDGDTERGGHLGVAHPAQLAHQ